jgi:uncharacterized membrane protein (DUF4010 family)
VTEPGQLDAAIRLMIAALIGLGVGLEREWSGHASGPNARFAGLRTFLLLGLTGGFGGLLFARGLPVAGGIVAGGGIAFAVVAYVMAVRRDAAELDGTTEASAILVVALGIIAGLGWLAIAAGAGSLVVLALSEKTRLHTFVGRVEERELRAALQFAVLALVVLPLLPSGPYLGDVQLRPRLLWSLVLVFSGLNFIGYVARRAVGPERGYGATGLLGGLVSSTAVTLTYSRQSRDEPGLSAPLARGVLGACTVMVVRVGVLTTALAPAVALELWPMLLPAAVAGAGFVITAWRGERDGRRAAERSVSNPLRLWSAIKLATLFQGGMTAVALVSAFAGDAGLYVTGVVLGIADVDALTVSMTRADAGVMPEIAARVIATGVVADTVLKLGMTLGLGSPAFRRKASPGLAVLSVATVIGLWLL